MTFLEADRASRSGAFAVYVTAFAAYVTALDAAAAGVGGLLLKAREPAALVRAGKALGRGGPSRGHRSRPIERASEVYMLTPKVTEITRGSAHAEKAGQATSGSRRRR